MSGCVYKTEDNKCKFWSDYGKGVVSYCDPCDCEEKTMSNADRIRAMTDEELAEWVAYSTSCVTCPVKNATDYECHNTDCKTAWFSWLKAPVEVDE